MKHGEQLAPLIDEVLEQAGVVRQDLTAFAVGIGPGPFTGLRVGLVTARTLAFVLDVPVVRRVHARRDRARGRRHGAGARATSWWPPTRGARRSTSRRTTSTAPRLPARSSSQPAERSRPTCRSRARARCSTPTRSRRPSGRRCRAPAWLAARSSRGAGRAAPTPSRSTCAGPTPPRRATPKPRLVTSGSALRRRRTSTRSPRWRQTCLGERRLVARAGGARASRGPADRAYLVAEVDGAVVGHAVASAVGDVAELQRIAVAAAHRRTGLASRAARRGRRARARRRRRDPAAAGGS